MSLKMLEKATSADCTEQCVIDKSFRLRLNNNRNKSNYGGNRKHIEKVQVYLSKRGDIFMKYAIVPYEQAVN